MALPSPSPLARNLTFSLFLTLLLPGHVALDSEISWPAYATFWGLLGEFDALLSSLPLPLSPHPPPW